MRFFLISFFMSITLFVSGCMSIPGTGVSINDLVAHTEDENKWKKIYPLNDHFWKFRAALLPENNDAKGVAHEIIRSPVIQNLTLHMQEISEGKNPLRRNISPDDFIAFAKLLTTNYDDLMSDLEKISHTQQENHDKRPLLTNKKDRFENAWIFPIMKHKGENTYEKTNFAKILITYLKAYGSGEFIDRQGINISKPNITSSGISDEDIQGLATVFFEAFFDAWLGTPVFYTLQYKVEPVYYPEADLSKKTGEIQSGISIKEYKRIYFSEYFANSEDEPTANKFVKSEEIRTEIRTDKKNNAEKYFDKDQARCIQRVSKIAGKQSKALTGITLGLLSNINVSFILGADFAIGDNKTLMHLAQTLAEVASRRWAEYATWRALDEKAENNKPVWCEEHNVTDNVKLTHSQ